MRLAVVPKYVGGAERPSAKAIDGSRLRRPRSLRVLSSLALAQLPNPLSDIYDLIAHNVYYVKFKIYFEKLLIQGFLGKTRSPVQTQTKVQIIKKAIACA